MRRKWLIGAMVLTAGWSVSVVLGQGAGPAAASAANAANPVVPSTPPEQAVSIEVLLPQLLQALSDDERLYMQHVTTLSDPFYEGRAPGSRGNEIAAEYLEFYFRQARLEPLFPQTIKAADGAEVVTPFASFRQTFPAGSEVKATVQKSSIAGHGDLTPGADFNVLGISGNAAVEAEAVFVGYGLESGPDGVEYNSFAGDEKAIEGKIAVVLRFEPLNERGRSRFGQGGAWSERTSLRPKLAAVARRNPAAIVLVNPPGVDDPRAGRLEDVRSTRAGQSQKVPVIMLSQARAEQFVAAAGKSLLQLRKAADEKGEIIPLAGTRMKIEAEVKRQPILTDNVGAVLRGRGPLSDQYIVLGAHFDHIGYGAFGSRAGSRAAGALHPGADDNASGTAGMLLAARRLVEAYAKAPADQPLRSIIFLGFCAEESGLNGSRHFVRNAPVPAASINAMVNLDMIGRVRRNKIDVSGVGTANGFADLLAPLFARSGLQVRTLPGGQGPSDHASFYAANIPVLHFFSGLTAEYHMPEDQFQTINFIGGARAARLAVDVVQALATRADKLEFTANRGQGIDMNQREEEPKVPLPGRSVPQTAVPSLPAPAATPAATPGGRDGAAAQAGPGMGGVRVRFGIAPDNYDDDKSGILVGEVYPNTSAADAGIKPGDRILKWNTTDIKGIAEWMPLLAAAKPGDKVELTVQRGSETIRTTATLKGREPADR